MVRSLISVDKNIGRAPPCEIVAKFPNYMLRRIHNLRVPYHSDITPFFIAMRVKHFIVDYVLANRVRISNVSRFFFSAPVGIQDFKQDLPRHLLSGTRWSPSQRS